MIIEIKLLNNTEAWQFVGQSIEEIMEWLGNVVAEIEWVALNGETIYHS